MQTIKPLFFKQIIFFQHLIPMRRSIWAIVRN